MQNTPKKKSLKKTSRSNTHKRGLHTRVNTKRVTKKAERHIIWEQDFVYDRFGVTGGYDS